MIEVHTERLFTGMTWMSGAAVLSSEYIEVARTGKNYSSTSFPLVLPWLIGAGASTEGYLERPALRDSVFQPEKVIVSLLRVNGVCRKRIVG